MKKVVLIIIAIVLGLSLLVYGAYYKFFTLQGLRGQELINESSSPNNEYVIKAYKNNGGMTVDWAVLCTLTDNRTGKTKNIFWQYRTDNAIIEWVDNDTVRINYVTLNLPDDTYDWRNNIK